MRIVLPAKAVDVPDGDRCISWNPEERDSKYFICQFFSERHEYISAREAQRDGLGPSGGTLSFYTCRLFDVGLANYKYGDGVYKCEQCLNSK